MNDKIRNTEEKAAVLNEVLQGGQQRKITL